MKIKKIKTILIGSTLFNIVWDKKENGAAFCFGKKEIIIGCRNRDDIGLLENIIHELHEIMAVIVNVRLERPDVQDDYIFVYDHRQHTTISEMMAGALAKFIR
jgi:hypothetical protein